MYGALLINAKVGAHNNCTIPTTHQQSNNCFVSELSEGGGRSNLYMVLKKNTCQQDWCANLYMVFNIIYNNG